MSHFDVAARTILKVRHGSHAYGLNTPESDVDEKGVCIKPRDCYLGFMKQFAQHETANPDAVTYCLAKFANLAADCNPNIIEVLHVDDRDILQCNEYGQRLLEAAPLFLSKKARYTFAGYAHAQLKRIKTHREWLLHPPLAAPTRKEFGLTETLVSAGELGAFESLAADGQEAMLPKDIVRLFVQERNYRAAKIHYDQYLNWQKSRNEKRAALEAKYGYDTKHGMHLLRLMRMCKEILSEGKVYVRRADREELLAVRRGERSYDSLIEEAERLEAESAALYETSSLPREPPRAKLDALVIDMTDDYLRRYG